MRIKCLRKSSLLFFPSCRGVLPTLGALHVSSESNLIAAAVAAASMLGTTGRGTNVGLQELLQSLSPPLVRTAPDGTAPPPPPVGEQPPAPSTSSILAASSGDVGTRSALPTRQGRTRASTRSGKLKTTVNSTVADAGALSLAGGRASRPSHDASPQLRSRVRLPNGATLRRTPQVARTSPLSLATSPLPPPPPRNGLGVSTMTPPLPDVAIPRSSLLIAPP